jgi:hypothetical protein
MPGLSVNQRLEYYAKVIIGSPYTAGDLLFTPRLQRLANSIETCTYERINSGFIDPINVLSSIPSFAGALGQVINGEKEYGKFPQMQVRQYDLQLSRTRCLNLFWCADYMAHLHSKAVPRPCMFKEVSKQEMDAGRTQMAWAARMSVRDWVDWGLVGDMMPPELTIT